LIFEKNFMSHKSKKEGKTTSFNKKTLVTSIMGVFSNTPDRALNYKQLSKKLEIKDDHTRKLISQLLGDLAVQGKLKEIHTGKFVLKTTGSYLTGTIDMNPAGFAFVVSEKSEQDIYIAERNLNRALNGDTVKVFLYAGRKGGRPEGEVVEVLHRSKKSFVGVVEITKTFAFLSPTERQMPYDIYIPLKNLKGAKEGDKAIAQITDWPAHMKNPIGEIIDVLGRPGSNDVEMHSILAEYELPYRFPPEVDAFANSISEKITEEDYAERRDFRNIPTFTIDPVDAKDFDDALSFQKLKNGNVEVGVHIADVSHFLKDKTILDDEAYQRATSVYLVDRVVPMLPERLSNFICSLRPNEEKLCYSAVFELDPEANVLEQWFGRTVICSDRRFTYDEAQAVIETGKGDMSDAITLLHKLAQKLRSGRFREGAISFERSEVKFNLDQQGKPLGVYVKENKESNQLIEEFMLLANRKVAEFIGKRQKGQTARTFVYRIHDKPNQEKLESFSRLASTFGYKVKTTGNKAIAQSVNKLLDNVQGKKEQDMLETLAIRVMAKAVYSTKNIGHYGLAFSHYTHFTSPIRRYPDVMVHRLLDLYLKKGASVSADKYEPMCEHSSERERLASEAERASIKYKQVEFMADKVGQTFEGVITGVTEYGLFVEAVETKCEGLIPMRDMRDDYYILDEENYSLVGKHSRKKYQLGDSVRIQLVRANLSRKQLDYKLAEEE
jgi:ribonuclease R